MDNKNYKISSKKDVKEEVTVRIDKDEIVINDGKEDVGFIPTPEKEKEESLTEKIEKHDTLNPKLFDEGNKLKPEVKEKILEIVDFFVDNLKEDGIKFDIADIVLVGSNCSYNYTEDSDLDIHIRYKEDGLQCPDNLYPLLYSAYRSIFNAKYDIDFYGIEAELFTEPEKGNTLVSNGIYSVLNDEWVKEPVAQDIPEINQEEIDAEVAKWVERFNQIVGEQTESLKEDTKEENKEHFLYQSELRELSNIYLNNLGADLPDYPSLSLDKIAEKNIKEKVTHNGKVVVMQLIKGGNFALWFSDEDGIVYKSDTSDKQAVIHINDKVKTGRELQAFLTNGEIPMETDDEISFDSDDLDDISTPNSSSMDAEYVDLTSLWYNSAENFLWKLPKGKTYTYANIEKYDYTRRGNNIIAYNVLNIKKDDDDSFTIWYSKGGKEGNKETHNLKEAAKVLYSFVAENRKYHHKLVDVSDEPAPSSYISTYASDKSKTDWSHRSLIKNNAGKEIYRKKKYDNDELARVASNWLIDNTDEYDLEDGWSPRGFIVSDGRISANDGGQRHGNIDRELFAYLRDEGYDISKDDFDDYDSGAQGSLLADILGFIRVNGNGENYVTVPKKQPTEAQFSALAEWIDGFFANYNYKTPIHVVTYDGHQVTYNPNDYTGSDVVKKVRNYYTTGELREKIKENFKLKRKIV